MGCYIEAYTFLSKWVRGTVPLTLSGCVLSKTACSSLIRSSRPQYFDYGQLLVCHGDVSADTLWIQGIRHVTLSQQSSTYTGFHTLPASSRRNLPKEVRSPYWSSWQFPIHTAGTRCRTCLDLLKLELYQHRHEWPNSTEVFASKLLRLIPHFLSIGEHSASKASCVWSKIFLMPVFWLNFALTPRFTIV